MTGPTGNIFASGLVEMIAGLASAAVLFGYAWWAPLVLAGVWLATHWLLHESGVWRDRNTEEVRQAQRHADYAYRLVVEPHAAKELRLFGLAGWVVDSFRVGEAALDEQDQVDQVFAPRVDRFKPAASHALSRAVVRRVSPNSGFSPLLFIAETSIM
jgi:hypothetical protein